MTIPAPLPHDLLDGSLADMVRHVEQSGAEAFGPMKSFSVQMPLPKGRGSGYWTLLKASPHLFILIGNFEYHEDQQIMVPSDQMAKVRILLSGSMRSNDGKVELDGTGAVVESYPGDGGSSYTIRGGQQTRIVILNCDRAFFEEELGLPPEILPYPISYLFDRRAHDSQGSVVPLGPDVLRAANDVFRAESRFGVPVIFPYLAAKGREIACAMITELVSFKNQSSSLVTSSVRDVSRINEARDIILDQFQRPPTIPQLAKTVGVNQTKLKTVFKATFGLTIHDFTQKCRMDRAAELLIMTDIGVAEVAYAVGYDHPASFTHAFKGYFGHPPSKIRRANARASRLPQDT